MNIPEGINKEEALRVIMKVAKRLAPKYVFATYEVEDIEQEAFLIGIAGLEKYDQNRPLENFMYTHINNRLKTFKRDNYYRLDYGTAAQKIQDRKKSLLEPIHIDALYNICTPDNIDSEAQINETLRLTGSRSRCVAMSSGERTSALASIKSISSLENLPFFIILSVDNLFYGVNDYGLAAFWQRSVLSKF